MGTGLVGKRATGSGPAKFGRVTAWGCGHGPGLKEIPFDGKNNHQGRRVDRADVRRLASPYYGLRTHHQTCELLSKSAVF